MSYVLKKSGFANLDSLLNSGRSEAIYYMGPVEHFEALVGLAYAAGYAGQVIATTGLPWNTYHHLVVWVP